MKMECGGCGATVDVSPAIPLNDETNTFEYRYECPNCGVRGHEFSWVIGDTRIYSQEPIPENAEQNLRLQERVSELEAQNAELLDTIRASRDDMKALPDIVEPGQTRLWTETVNSVWENLDGVLNDVKFQKLPTILGELDALRKAVHESQERFIEVRKATGSSTPLADFARLVALLRSTDTNNDLAGLLFESAQEQDTPEAWDDWAFAYMLLCSSELKDEAALED